MDLKWVKVTRPLPRVPLGGLRWPSLLCSLKLNQRYPYLWYGSRPGFLADYQYYQQGHGYTRAQARPFGCVGGRSAILAKTQKAFQVL